MLSALSSLVGITSSSSNNNSNNNNHNISANESSSNNNDNTAAAAVTSSSHHQPSSSSGSISPKDLLHTNNNPNGDDSRVSGSLSSNNSSNNSKSPAPLTISNPNNSLPNLALNNSSTVIPNSPNKLLKENPNNNPSMRVAGISTSTNSSTRAISPAIARNGNNATPNRVTKPIITSKSVKDKDNKDNQESSPVDNNNNNNNLKQPTSGGGIGRHTRTLSGGEARKTLLSSASNANLSNTQGFTIVSNNNNSRPQTAQPSNPRDRASSTASDSKTTGTTSRSVRFTANQPTGLAALATVNNSTTTTNNKRVIAGGLKPKSQPGTLKKGQFGSNPSLNSSNSLASLDIDSKNNTTNNNTNNSKDDKPNTNEQKSTSGSSTARSVTGATKRHNSITNTAGLTSTTPTTATNSSNNNNTTTVTSTTASTINRLATSRRPGSRDLTHNKSNVNSSTHHTNTTNASNTNNSSHNTNTTHTVGTAATVRMSAADRSLMQDVIYIQNWFQTLKQTKNFAPFAKVILTVKQTIFTPAQVKRQRVKQKIAATSTASTTNTANNTTANKGNTTARGVRSGVSSNNTGSTNLSHKNESDIDGDLDELGDDDDNNNNGAEEEEGLFDDLPDSVFDSKISNYIKKTERDDETLLKSHRDNISPAGVQFVNGRWVPVKENVIVSASAPNIDQFKRQTSGSDSDNNNNNTSTSDRNHTHTTNSEDDLDLIPDFDDNKDSNSTNNNSQNNANSTTVSGTSQSVMDKLHSSTNSNILSTDVDDESTDLTDTGIEISVSKNANQSKLGGDDFDELDQIPDFDSPDTQSTNIQPPINNTNNKPRSNMVTFTTLPANLIRSQSGNNKDITSSPHSDSTTGVNPTVMHSAAKQFLLEKVSQFPDSIDISDELNELESEANDGNISSDSASNTQVINAAQLHNINSSNTSSTAHSNLFVSSGSVVAVAKRLEAKMRGSMDMNMNSFPMNIDDLDDIQDESALNHDTNAGTGKKAASGPATRELHEFELNDKLIADFNESCNTHNNEFAPGLSTNAVTNLLSRDTLTSKIKLDWILAQAELYAKKLNKSTDTIIIPSDKTTNKTTDKPNTSTNNNTNTSTHNHPPVKRSGTPTLMGKRH